MILLDTNIFIYHFLSHPDYGSDAKRLFLMIESGELLAKASFVTYAEILTLPATKKDEELIKKYRQLLLEFPNLEFCPINAPIAHRASLMRGEFPVLKLMDAFILATAFEEKAEMLITEDKKLFISSLPFAVKSLNGFFKI